MSHTEAFKEFYKRCKEMDIEETVEVALNAESEEEQEFVELISNFMMKTKQKEVIGQCKAGYEKIAPFFRWADRLYFTYGPPVKAEFYGLSARP